MTTAVRKWAVVVAGLVGALTFPLQAPHARAAAANPAMAPAVSIANTLTTVEGAFYRPVPPTRLLDANATNATRLNAGGSATVDVTGVGGVPQTGVAAVLVNLVGSRATLPTTLTVAASGVPAPTTSNLELLSLVIADNLAIVAVGTDGNIVIRNSAGRAYVGVDLLGWFPTATDLHTVQPARVLDTRNGSAADTPVRSGQPVNVTIAGRAGVPASGAGMAVVNVTALDATAITTLSLAARGAATPQTPTMDIAPLLPASKLAIVAIGTGGQISVTTSTGRVNAIVDVLAWLPTTTDLRLVAPQPLLATKPDRWSGRLAANGDLDVQVGGRAGVPSSGVSAVILSVSALAATRATTLTVHPTGTTRPPTSSVEVPPLVPADNLVVVPLGADGKVRIHNALGTVRVAVDVFGWFAEDPPPTTGSWSFEPSSLMFTAAGQTADVVLVHHGDDGTPTGAPIPSGITTAITDTTGVIAMAEIGRGRYRITATAAIGLATVDATVPGIATPARLTVTTTQLQPAVQVIATDRVVFPPASGTTTQTGPFTLDETLARTVIPSNADLQAAQDPFSLGARLGVVLRGAAPPTGAVVISADGSLFAGRVVEPAGLPTLTRSGHALITVAITGPMDVFRKLDVDVEQTESTVDTPPAAPFAARSNLLASRLVNDAPSGPCTADAGHTGLELTFNPPTRTTTRWVKGHFDVDAQIAQLKIGYQSTSSVGFSAKVQSAITAEVTCVVKDFGSSDVVTGTPLDAVLTVFFRPHLDLKLELTVANGARAEFSASCSQFTMRQIELRYTGALGPSANETKSDPPPQCTREAKVTGTAGDITPLSVEIKGGLYLVVDIGLRFGGRIAAFFEDLTGAPVGEMQLLSVSIGVRVRVAWENEPVVLANKKSESTAALELVIDAGIKIPVLESLVKFVTGVDSSISIQLYQAVIQLLVLYRPPAAAPLTINVNHHQVNGVVTVKPGDDIDIHEQLGWQGNEPAVPEARVESATAWLARTGLGAGFDPFTDFQLSTQPGPPAELTATATITRALCDRLGNDTRSISFLANAPMFGAATNGFAGSIDLKCEGPTIAFDRDLVDFDTTQVGAPTTVHLTGKNLSLGDWTIAAPPAWLTVDPRSGDFQSAEETDDVVLTVDCTKVTPRAQVDTTLVASATRPADSTSYEARLTVQADCRDTLVDFTPNSVTADTTVMLNSRGPSPTTWELSGIPTWAKITPTSGSFAAGTAQASLAVDITQRKRSCGTQVERRATVTATAPGRGTATLTVVDPELTPKPSCSGPKTTGGSGGDPHMLSMDGIRYDAQVLGEYVYLQPAAGASGATVHVRHDYTQFSAGFARPTSLVGVAVAVDGHTIEVLSRPDEVRIDGVAVDLAVGVPTSVSDSLSVTQSVAQTYLIDGADLAVTAARGLSDTINLWITAPIGAPYVGLLGAPDRQRGQRPHACRVEHFFHSGRC